jgi:putative ABC transport system ATP-binding protein
MIKLQNLSKSYSKENGAIIKAADNLNLEIRKGEFVAVTGPSGSGKSTLMNMIGLLDIPDSGNYFLNGREISKLSDDELAGIRSSKIGFVFQQFHLLSGTTAKENVEVPLIYSNRKEIAGLADEALIRVGLGDRLNHLPEELSGGQQQRVAIARALVNDPEIILADEPTGNLDSKSGLEIIAIFQELNRRGKTILLITHDANIALHANRIIKMADGRIIEESAVANPKEATAELKVLLNKIDDATQIKETVNEINKSS